MSGLRGNCTMERYNVAPGHQLLQWEIFHVQLFLYLG